MRSRFLQGFVFFLALPFVSAADLFSFGGISSSFLQSAEELFSPFFEAVLNTNSFDDYFFAKILLLFLLYMVIYAVLKKIDLFKKTKGVPAAVSAIVSVLAIRFMSDNSFIEGVLLPYGALGIAVVTFLPFFIYFWFIHQSVSGGLGRRIGWGLYGIIFLVVWGLRSSDVSGASDLIYFLGILAVAASFFFDDAIHKYFKLGELNKSLSHINNSRIAHLIAEYNYLKMNLPEGNLKDDRLNDLKEQIKKAGGSISDL